MLESKITDLSEELRRFLTEKGAELVGFGDMRGVNNCSLPVGVSVAVTIPREILREIEEGPTKSYYALYNELNNKLDKLVSAGADFLKAKGYLAFPQTTGAVSLNEDWRTKIPHKTVATAAGLGWIGRNCLLVTEKYGSAIRLSSLITDAPLILEKAVKTSKCGDCHICCNVCPAHALKDVLWCVDVDRGEMLEKEKCKEKQIELMRERTGLEVDLCGQCFVHCPYTRRYLNG
ncbi:MAG: epoxyqueuosine reductase [Oscillospiraceae bacterium]